jgi:3-oxoacyl-[acyl-carrier protein] reductase
MPDKTILICGANAALAKALMGLLAEKKGYARYLTQSRVASLECLNIVLPEHQHFQVDLSETEQVDEFCQQLKNIESIDHIVYFPAPTVVPTPFRKLKACDFQLHMQVQFFALQQILSCTFPAMAQRKSGRVVTISSEYILGTPPSGLSHYVAAKQAQWGLIKSLAAEYASKNIQLNAIAPAMIDTPYLEGLPNALLEATAKQHPLGRLATVEDIVPVIDFLLSESSGFITGTLLPVTGKA